MPPARNHWKLLVLALAAAALPSAGLPPRQPAPEFPSTRSEALEQLRQRLPSKGKRAVLRGEDSWLFLHDEARLLLCERFWGAGAEASDLIESPAARDPLPEVLRFRRQLEERGVGLLFVPIPAKLAAYPERLLSAFDPRRSERLDAAVPDFLRELEAHGVHTLDLLPELLAAKAQGEPALYLATDSHWSPRGIRVAARALAEHLRRNSARWMLAVPPPRPFEVSTERVTIRGDIAAALRNSPPGPETVEIVSVVGEPEADELGGARRASPILLLGDSYLNVYSEYRSDFRSHLEAELGLPLDRVAVNAGGPTGSRQALARAPERLEGKRLVVWLTASRLFVSGPGWYPVELPPAASASPVGAPR